MDATFRRFPNGVLSAGRFIGHLVCADRQIGECGESNSGNGGCPFCTNSAATSNQVDKENLMSDGLSLRRYDYFALLLWNKFV